MNVCEKLKKGRKEVDKRLLLLWRKKNKESEENLV